MKPLIFLGQENPRNLVSLNFLYRKFLTGPGGCAKGILHPLVKHNTADMQCFGATRYDNDGMAGAGRFFLACAPAAKGRQQN